MSEIRYQARLRWLGSCLKEEVFVSNRILIDVATGLYRSCDDRMGLVQLQVVA